MKFMLPTLANTISTIDDSTNAVVSTISVGITPYGIVFDSHNDKLFVANNVDNTVTSVSDSSITPSGTVESEMGPLR